MDKINELKVRAFDLRNQIDQITVAYQQTMLELSELIKKESENKKKESSVPTTKRNNTRTS